MPTLCDYLGIECPEDTAGQSLLSDENDSDARFIVSEGVYGHPRSRSIRNRNWMLVWEPDGNQHQPNRSNPYELYDLRRDPDQRRDLLVEEPDAPQVRVAMGGTDASAQTRCTRV